MAVLRVDPSWHTQIAMIRDAHSDDTNIIRFDNTFYRVCSASGGQFMVELMPTGGVAADSVKLAIGARDFYVSHVDGRSFDQYAKTLDLKHIDAGSLENAVREVKTATGTRLFELQSMLVFCVAESLRSDLIATQVSQTISASMGKLLGAATRIAIGKMLGQAHAWGQSSDAVWASLKPEVRAAFSTSADARTPTAKRLSERVNENAIDPALRITARGIKVLKRPVK